MQNQLYFRVFAMLLVYGVLKYMGGLSGTLLLYPVTMLVTFLHEFGHAMGAILTGGRVEGLQVNSDGSGYTTTLGGSPGIVLIGAIWAAQFWETFFFASERDTTNWLRALYW